MKNRIIRRKFPAVIFFAPIKYSTGKFGRVGDHEPDTRPSPSSL